MVATVGEFIEYLEHLGFVQHKRKHGGSHIWFLVHNDGRRVKLAGERSRNLTIGLFNSLCQQAEIDYPTAKSAIWN